MRNRRQNAKQHPHQGVDSFPARIHTEGKLQRLTDPPESELDRGRCNPNRDPPGLPRTTGTIIRMGDATLEVWRDCAPCSRMYQTVGPGAREALAGTAGISARVVKGGMIRVGDRLDIEPS